MNFKTTYFIILYNAKMCFAIARLISVSALITFLSSELEFDET